MYLFRKCANKIIISNKHTLFYGLMLLNDVILLSRSQNIHSCNRYFVNEKIIINKIIIYSKGHTVYDMFLWF